MMESNSHIPEKEQFTLSNLWREIEEHIREFTERVSYVLFPQGDSSAERTKNKNVEVTAQKFVDMALSFSPKDRPDLQNFFLQELAELKTDDPEVYARITELLEMKSPKASTAFPSFSPAELPSAA